MASAFSHALVAITIGKTFSSRLQNFKFFLAGCICAVIPDLDVIAFSFGIPYDSVLGHRGFFHSAAFCMILSFLTCLFFMNQKESLARLFLFFFLCALSHAIFDMLTNGGLGVAIFSPFDNTRYFFPFRPVQVSPIGIGNFFTGRGLRVISSEMIWIGFPCLLTIIITRYIRKKKCWNLILILFHFLKHNVFY